MSVGNDVVDLADPESRLGALHPRWIDRVFGAGEREALDASRSRLLLHWALWAAKESAFKARKRLAPRAVFSPREYEIELSSFPPTTGVARGRALHRGEAFDVEVHLDGDVVHAVATSGGDAAARVLWRVGSASGDPGPAARRLAVAALGPALGADTAVLRVCGRPPVLVDRERRLELDVSLSHHGRFVACAATRIDSISPATSRVQHAGPEDRVHS